MTRHAVSAIAVGCLFMLPMAATAQVAQPFAGSVKKVTGDVVLRRGNERIAVTEGMHLFPHDVLETPAGGSLGFILEDGTRVAMGGNTSLEIDQFLYQPSDGKFGLLLRLVRGVMVYVSGKMAKFSPDSIRLETPVAVVGVRGTEVAISLEGSQQP